MIVVEHDEDAIRAADHVIDMGPGAGVHGGQVIAQGTPDEVAASADSLTGQYLGGRAADRGADASASRAGATRRRRRRCASSARAATT